MEERNTKKKSDNRESDIVFSHTIKAGKRIYYLDVKKNRKEELFLAITESKKVTIDEQSQYVQFEKHKIFLYKEDFDKFQEALNETLDFIRENNTVDFVPHHENGENTSADDNDSEILNEKIDLKIDF
ncbi:MAG: PUR family DNA/RNA-binding protein [Dysgonamonadaceae bacterium]|jgi:hypothetical protein|nr:PUR family DNA/RNA-binding protein [Dysgonamonadaceae bacterium]